MNGASLRRDLYGFATDLRKLAYTMPGGHEDPLLKLSERMVRYANQTAAEGESPSPRFAKEHRQGSGAPGGFA